MSQIRRFFYIVYASARSPGSIKSSSPLSFREQLVPVILTNWAAASLFLIGLSVALLLEARAAGAVVFSSGVVVMGVGALGRERAVGIALILVGAAAIVRVVEHNVTGVDL